ncbi:MAG: PAS domain-containing protein [Acidobacteriota bacterium]|nr:PAS domain-containing protein [Acidobacteriota bacterium]
MNQPMANDEETASKSRRPSEFIRDAEAFIDGLIDQSPTPTWISDDQGNLVHANRALCELLNINEDEVVGKYNVLRDGIVRGQGFMPLVESVFREGKNVRFPLVYDSASLRSLSLKAGVVVILDVSIFPIKDRSGKIRHAVIQHIDVTERKKAEDSLRKERGFLESIVENIPNMIFVKEAKDLRFIRFNKAGEDLLGVRREDLYGKTDRDFFPEEEAGFFQSKDREVLTKKALVDIPEETIQTRTHGPRTIHTKKIPLLDEWGEPEYLLGISEDITERKRDEDRLKTSLAEKEVLLREVHHRVMSNLQVITSLLRLQLAATGDESCRAFYRSTYGRIRTIAMVHEKLYASSDLSRIDFGDYVQELAVHLFQFHQVDPRKVRLTTNIEKVSLDVQTAIPCGLILNELIINALLHAFPDGRNGTIEVGLKIPAFGGFELSVADDGVSLPPEIDAASTPTLGLQVVHLLAEQIDGAVEVDRNGGTRIRIVSRRPIDPS